MAVHQVENYAKKIEKVGNARPGALGKVENMKVNTVQSILVIAVGSLLDYIIDFVN